MPSIELAIKNEATEMEFYLNQAKRSRNPLAQALFQTLAADEKEHMTRIRELHGKLVADGSWPEEMPIQVAGTDVKHVLDSISRDSVGAAEHDDDDIAALKKGAEFEARGAKFYSDLAAECTNPQEAKLFRFLSGIEREHLLSIKDSLFYLEDPEGWLAEKERHGLDGA
jgi:rubrerythrin